MKSYSTAKVREELAGWQKIRAVLSDDLDPQTLLDTLEGETNLFEAILVVEEEILEHEILLAGLEKMLATLGERKSRHKATIETLRTTILAAMDRAEIPTIRGATATLTRRKTPGQPIIDDEAEIPSEFFVPQPPKLDKAKLKEALANGPVSGAHLSNGGISLTIRRK